MRLRFAPSAARQWNDENFYRHPDEERAGRGICKGFSVSSRRTMLNKLNMVSKSTSLPDFITLTFPDDCFRDSVTEFARHAKSTLDTWLKRLKRVAPEAAGFWRMEWQSRKSGPLEGKLFPHFHLMMWNLARRATGRFGQDGNPVSESFVSFEDQQVELDFFSTLTTACGAVEVPEGEGASLPEVTENSSSWKSIFMDGAQRRVFVGVTAGLTKGGECRGMPRRLEKAIAQQMDERVNRKQMSFFDWSSLSWYHVVGSGNLKHFMAGVSVERVKSWGGVMSYCSKYMAKLGEHNFLTDVPVGRSWGIFNRVYIPWGKMMELPLPEEMGVRVRRIMRRYLQRVRGRKYNAPYGITFYGDVAQWSRLWEPPPDTPF